MIDVTERKAEKRQQDSIVSVVESSSDEEENEEQLNVVTEQTMQQNTFHNKSNGPKLSSHLLGNESTAKRKKQPSSAFADFIRKYFNFLFETKCFKRISSMLDEYEKVFFVSSTTASLDNDSSNDSSDEGEFDEYNVRMHWLTNRFYCDPQLEENYLLNETELYAHRYKAVCIMCTLAYTIYTVIFAISLRLTYDSDGFEEEMYTQLRKQMPYRFAALFILLSFSLYYYYSSDEAELNEIRQIRQMQSATDQTQQNKRKQQDKILQANNISLNINELEDNSDINSFTKHPNGYILTIVNNAIDYFKFKLCCCCLPTTGYNIKRCRYRYSRKNWRIYLTVSLIFIFSLLVLYEIISEHELVTFKVRDMTQVLTTICTSVAPDSVDNCLNDLYDGSSLNYDSWNIVCENDIPCTNLQTINLPIYDLSYQSILHRAQIWAVGYPIAVMMVCRFDILPTFCVSVTTFLVWILTIQIVLDKRVVFDSYMWLTIIESILLLCASYVVKRSDRRIYLLLYYTEEEAIRLKTKINDLETSENYLDLEDENDNDDDAESYEGIDTSTPLHKALEELQNLRMYYSVAGAEEETSAPKGVHGGHHRTSSVNSDSGMRVPHHTHSRRKSYLGGAVTSPRNSPDSMAAPVNRHHHGITVNGPRYRSQSGSLIDAKNTITRVIEILQDTESLVRPNFLAKPKSDDGNKTPEVVDKDIANWLDYQGFRGRYIKKRSTISRTNSMLKANRFSLKSRNSRINSDNIFEGLDDIKVQANLSNSSSSTADESTTGRLSPLRTKRVLGSQDFASSSGVLMRKFSHTNSQICVELNNWNLDVFEFNEATGLRPLYQMLWATFSRQNLLKIFKIDHAAFKTFAMKLDNGYANNEYHNSIHAADVLNSTHYILCGMNMGDHLSSLKFLSAYLAAAIHDFKHPGRNNRFLINSRDKLAVMYSDMSVLEHMHLSEAFKLMLSANTNILVNLTTDQYKSARQDIIRSVLATDLAVLFDTIVKLKALPLDSPYPLKLEDNIELLLDVTMKVSDIGHSGKAWKLHKQWSDRLCEEFFKQGDEEKARKLPMSPFMDRANPQIGKSQVGFFEYIAMPLWEAVYAAAPAEYEDLITQARSNFKEWKSILEQENNRASV